MAESQQLRDLLSQLSLEEKVSLLSGADGWQTQEISRLGIGSLKTSDGPAGARGALSIDGPTAAFLPAPVAQAATWSKTALYEIGQLLCREAKTKAAQVLLAPTICCARNPLGGRNFEAYGEDPFLSGSLAIEYVRGVQQSNEVAATVKHFVANEQEYQRFTINAEVGERALREIYLRPFEMAIKSANPPKCVMTAYNCVNGSHMDMNRKLVQETLRGEWGFQGLVMSDWGGTNSTTESIVAGCDLEMPGPPEKRGNLLLSAMAEKPSKELLDAIDSSCLRVLKLLQHLGLLGLSAEEAKKTRNRLEHSSNEKDDQCLLREVAAKGIVLLKNSSQLLPLNPTSLQGKKVAFVGPNALHGTPGGGGSATMNPQYQTQPFAAFNSFVKDLGIDVEISHSPGTFSHKWLPLTTADQWKATSEQANSTGDGKAMLRLDFFSTADFSGPIIETQWRDSSLIDLFDSAPTQWYSTKNLHSFRVTSQVTPQTSGTHSFGISSVGNSRLFVDGKLLIDNYHWSDVGESFYSFGSREARASFPMEAGRSYTMTIESSSRIIPENSTAADDPVHVFGVQPSVRLGFLLELPSDPITSAVALAKASDLTIVILGLNDEWESEGYDRQSMKLPGEQDQLVKALLESTTHPENIVIVNQSGSPVEMLWADKANTILQAWYGGQEAGNALCDVIFGRVAPEGRLPISWPRQYTDLPFAGNKRGWPGVDGVVNYEEGTLVGYRWYQQHNVQPRWWFGYGLGFTTFTLSDITVEKVDGGWRVRVVVTNVGALEGREVVQCYSWPVVSKVHELRAFEKTKLLSPGESEAISLTVSSRDLAYWEEKAARWIKNAGTYVLGLGKHAGDVDMIATTIHTSETLSWAP